jgi:phthiocerol/phenolphthiocerol synthesis type-I polyketide synthase E
MSSMLSIAETIGQSDPRQQVTQIWESLLGVSPIAPDQNYFDLGGDSILAVQMFAQIERVFQVKLPVATLFEAPTIGDLVEILNRETPKFPGGSLVAIQTKGSKPPFFCMHGAGGNVLIYRELAEHLGEDQPFYGLQSLGLDGKIHPLTRIEEMASAYVGEIRRLQPHGPYYVGGYCSGGTIAYEVAQQLKAIGEEVALVAIFDTLNWNKLAPANFWQKTATAFERIIFHILNFVPLDGRGKRAFLKEKFQALRNRIPVWRALLVNKFFGSSGDQELESSLIAKIWTLNDQAAANYVPKPYAGAITDFRPREQYSIYKRNDLKWEGLALGGQNIVELSVYPAGMLVEPFVGVLAQALRKSIDSSMKSSQ